MVVGRLPGVSAALHARACAGVKIAVRDTELFFDVEGPEFVPDGPVLRQKPTVILLHGGPGADHWRPKPAFSRLRSVAQVVYLDHRGHGRSGRGDASTWTLGPMRPSPPIPTAARRRERCSTSG